MGREGISLSHLYWSDVIFFLLYVSSFSLFFFPLKFGIRQAIHKWCILKSFFRHMKYDFGRFEQKKTSPEAVYVSLPK